MLEGQKIKPPKITEDRPQVKESGFRAVFAKLKKRRMIETLAAFIGGGWLLVEVVERLLVGHYKFPKESIDLTVVSVIGALLSTLVWRWFSGTEKRPGNVKVEVLIVPLIILIALAIALNLILQMAGIPGRKLQIGIMVFLLGIAWVIFKLSQWATGMPESGKKEVRALSPVTANHEKSIVVLPFKNMSADPEQEYFCEGIAEELINALAQIRGLRVVARTSAFSFKGKDLDIREIGGKLNVETALEGSVRKAENRLRITVQLINVANGFHLWSERYDRDMADIFAIQDEISLAIVDKLEVKLLGKEKTALVKRHTDDPEAYNLYLKSRSSIQMLTEEGFKRGLDYLERAAAKDPDFALPLAGLSYLYVARSYWGKMRPHDAYPKAREYARQALEKNDSLAMAYAGFGFAKTFYDWDWPGAEREFERALELNPNSADIHQGYSFLLTITQRHDEAVIEAKKAQELDPLSSHINTHAAQTLHYAGRADEAVELLKETISLDPTYFLAHFILYRIYDHKSMAQEALTECEKTVELSGGHPLAVIALVRAYNGVGQTIEADKLEKSLRDRSQTEYIPAICFFGIHLWRKEFEQAAEWLEKACAERDGFLPWTLVHPDTRRRVPDLPIFNDILKKYGLKS